MILKEQGGGLFSGLSQGGARSEERQRDPGWKEVDEDGTRSAVPGHISRRAK